HLKPSDERERYHRLRELFKDSLYRSQRKTGRHPLTISQLSLFSSKPVTPAVWTAYCDGASRGNPGPASFGVVVCRPDGQVAKEIKVFVGINTNQVAEYEALIRALEELTSLGARRAQVFTDSQFVTKQFS